MEKLVAKSEEFLAYDLKGRPKMLSRSGAFVDRAREEQSPKQSPAFQNNTNPATQPSRPTGATRYFGGFDAIRSRLTGKTQAA